VIARSVAVALAAFHLFVAATAPKDPKIIDIRDYNRVWGLCIRGDIAESLGGCRALLQRGWLTKGGIALAYSHLAGAYLADSQLEQALVNVDAALRYDPQAWYGFYTRARVHTAKRDYQRAIADYERVMFFRPLLADPYVSRGDIHRMLDRFDLAEADFERAIAMDESSPTGFAARGNLNRDRGRYDLALADYDKAIALDQNYTPAFNRRCFVRTISGGDLDAALADCERALQLAPGNGAILATRALANLRRGDLAAAHDDSEAAVAADATLPEAHLARALVRLRYGRDTEARADLAEAERLEPGIGAEYAVYGLRP
jgi:tetratricopeptide (TPR) repeat protein